jgi:hypothetical protein
MESLISELRALVGDVVGEGKTPAFTDEEIQTRLDRTLDGVAVADAVEADFDVWSAAADVCEMWAARLKDDVDFKDGNREVKDSQKAAGLLVLAGRFRQRSDRGVGVGSLTNSDYNT